MTQAGHVALAGAPNVGKSSLLNTLVGTHLAIVSPKAQATRLPVVGLRTDGDIQYVFHDLPGLLEPAYLMQARMRALALDALERMDRRSAPPSSTRRRRRRRCRSWPGSRSRYRPRSLIVYTKGDLVPAARRAELADLGVVVSAATGEGIETLLARIRGPPARAGLRVRSRRRRHPAAPLLRGRVPARGRLRAPGRRAALQLHRRGGGVSRGSNGPCTFGSRSSSSGSPRRAS